MKSGDAVTLSTLRLVLAAVHNEEIKVQRELRPEEIHRIIATLCKQRGEAIDLYRKGNRDDLARKEEAELEVLKRWLPQPLSDQEVKNIIQASIAEAAPVSPSGFSVHALVVALCGALGAASALRFIVGT